MCHAHDFSCVHDIRTLLQVWYSLFKFQKRWLEPILGVCSATEGANTLFLNESTNLPPTCTVTVTCTGTQKCSLGTQAFPVLRVERAHVQLFRTREQGKPGFRGYKNTCSYTCTHVQSTNTILTLVLVEAEGGLTIVPEGWVWGSEVSGAVRGRGYSSQRGIMLWLEREWASPTHYTWLYKYHMKHQFHVQMHTCTWVSTSLIPRLSLLACNNVCMTFELGTKVMGTYCAQGGRAWVWGQVSTAQLVHQKKIVFIQPTCVHVLYMHTVLNHL